AVLAASPGCAPAFPPGFLDAPNPHAVSPLFVSGFSEAESHKKIISFIFQSVSAQLVNQPNQIFV
ncbi:hypothetical protein ABK730_08205, partial [Klebsiella indica]|uniref:hypothetical protein n=1 Tax=Klebsiella TaxID=570 RepID=UPI003753566D